MTPDDYFPNLYLEDLNIFSEGSISGNGPQGMLCGMTMEKILRPPKGTKYNNIKGFISVLYALNLINQGIHFYFREDFSEWCMLAVPFADCQACPSYHGGISRPNSIIKYVSTISYGININKMRLKEYTKHLFLVYLKETVDQQRFISVTHEKLIEKLKTDSDCPEFAELIK